MRKSEGIMEVLQAFEERINEKLQRTCEEMEREIQDLVKTLDKRIEERIMIQNIGFITMNKRIEKMKSGRPSRASIPPKQSDPMPRSSLIAADAGEFHLFFLDSDIIPKDSLINVEVAQTILDNTQVLGSQERIGGMVINWCQVENVMGLKGNLAIGTPSVRMKSEKFLLGCDDHSWIRFQFCWEYQ